MKSNYFKKAIVASAFGLAAILGTGEVANAQGNRQVQRQQQRVERQQDRVERQRERLEDQRQKLALERQREEQLRLERLRQQQQQQASRNRYRVYRNGGYYETDNRGAELLRQAVNRGYQEGFRAGQADRTGRRSGGYRNSSVYRSGNYGYQSYVEMSQYQYYFRQGFERGYQDGYNSRYQYGSRSNGGLNILGAVLQGILNIRSY